MTSKALNDALEGRPESQVLERIVEPTSGDTKVGLMWCHVVDAVVLARQDDVQVLEDGDVPGQAKVCVRPFVDLQIT